MTTIAEEKNIQKVKNWLKTVGIDPSKSEDLISKYGIDNTVNLVKEALMAPHPMAKHLDGKPRSSKSTINYILENDLSAESISTITKKNLQTVTASMPQTTNVSQTETPEVHTTNDTIDTRTQTHSTLIDQAEASHATTPDKEKVNPVALSQSIRFDKRLNIKAAEAEIPTTTTTETVELPHVTYIKEYSWKDAMADSLVLNNVSAEDFLAKAKNKFSQNEGRINEPYFDCDGHPTVGIGMLITKRNDIKTPTILQDTSLASEEGKIISATNIINDKDAYYIHNGKRINLYSSHKDKKPNITSIPEGSNIDIFDSQGNKVTVRRIHNAGAKILAVNEQDVGELSNNEVDKLYINRVKGDYKRVSRAVPGFENMPEHVQYVAVHMSFYSPATFTKDYEKIFGKAPGEDITPLELMNGIENFYDGRNISNAARENIKLAKAEAEELNKFTLSQRKVYTTLTELTPIPTKLLQTEIPTNIKLTTLPPIATARLNQGRS